MLTSLMSMIESTGIPEPMPIAATFDSTTEAGERLNDVALIDTMVTVVDAHDLLAAFGCTDLIAARSLRALARHHSPGEKP